MSTVQQTIAWAPSMSRRSFLASVATGSLVLASRSSGMGLLLDAAEEPFDPDLFVSIAPDGVVSILAHRSEMGTGIRTALPMIALRVFVNGEHGLLSIAVGTATCAMTWLGAVYLLHRALPAEIDLVRAQVLGRLVGARAQ